MQTETFQQRNTTYLSLEKWENLVEGLTVGFSTKSDGVSKEAFSTLNLGLHVNDQPKSVIENREILANRTDFPLNNWVFAEQIHSTHIEKVTKLNCGRGLYSYDDGLSNCDGLYTAEKGIMLSLCFADCVPLYFLSPQKLLIGVAHAGWKGTVNDIGGNMIRKWTNVEGVNPSEIKVAIGPAIGPCCYIVDDRVISAINKSIIEKYPLTYSKITEGQYKLDLKKLNKYLLLEAGIQEENITVSHHCTSCEKEIFFSHRRDEGKTGRMLSFIGIYEEA
ncbi:peptidoglycan editing factor PgeF [Metabacillus sediminilitoris]|uniref:Purine nucleoside phosphorylase n=1 Tax=Metabacillus sediminilitoris TaxID=2567941 RepID=A0A4S4C767_9BACI|nr:peptidoglycan editing factor PgeF [Metabacillus sediminilitoris]QGQ46936.1 peptidoglycan editing factor PgeF [Metabacillus sediminilitoris]THF83085.1 peptidoglycan editing factor PgeF [Metabacillus sediminilitoris]